MNTYVIIVFFCQAWVVLLTSVRFSLWCLLEVHCGGGFYVRSLVRDIGIGKNLAYLSRCENCFLYALCLCSVKAVSTQVSTDS